MTAPRFPVQAGPRALSALLPAVTRAAIGKQGAMLARLTLDWDAVVGPAIGSATLPRRLAGGTLTIACAGPLALELQHLSAELIDRVNAYMGRAVAQRLRLVQDHALPRPPRAPTPPPIAPPPPADPGASALETALAALAARLDTARRPR